MQAHAGPMQVPCNGDDKSTVSVFESYARILKAWGTFHHSVESPLTCVVSPGRAGATCHITHPLAARRPPARMCDTPPKAAMPLHSELCSVKPIR